MIVLDFPIRLIFSAVTISKIRLIFSRYFALFHAHTSNFSKMFVTLLIIIDFVCARKFGKHLDFNVFSRFRGRDKNKVASS